MRDNSLADQQTDTTCEVLVIGSGPAGSTIAALLAERGRDVVLLEKATHPRFHIGESLLPLNLPLFDQLGVREEVERIGMVKYGVEFVSPWHGDPVTFEFADAWDKSFPHAYQVPRADFDHILFKKAVSNGAKPFEGHKVTGIEFLSDEGAKVTALDGDKQSHTFHTRFVVDASGRDTFLANHFGIKSRDKKHNSAALYGHFTNATRLPGKSEGHISLFWFDHGWFWFIPLSDGTTSVGAVCWPYYMKTRKTDPAQFLMETIALCPALQERLKDAQLATPVTATGNYSYKSSRTAGQNYLLLGDAFAFIDPVFSSGVFLAMNSAFVGADTVETCLDTPQKTAGALKAFDATMRRGPKVFSWFIYRITTPTLRHMFLRPRNVFHLQEAMLSLLAGDIFRGTPLALRLLVFKTFYYMNSLFNFKESWMAWKKRKLSISAAGTEMTVDQKS
ncbi:NAD(P)/FAD-dependent oxidoreductase [Sulfurirhabdus autotrophica]|uniref:Flavin-dependent dehydrogenase n=1 Tax=Sulfurirhabdus autotrophica TaxID=1706046 RepID=A0A4R3YAP2_9PROT|nr:NAD(P)/FAD-dependent oxidoreductase [Sulfurirhabdus autotrophica]TCV87453.1 flavin-dependent dehydrogenase [Sulfurirhabdus autotrophica]